MWALGPAAALLQPGRWGQAPCCKHEPLARCPARWHGTKGRPGAPHVLPWGDEGARRLASSPCAGMGLEQAARGWRRGPSTESRTQRRAEIITVKPLLQKD